ncbi:unnamed protein product [Sphagnum balticum]
MTWTLRSESEDDGTWLAHDNAEAGGRDSVSSRGSHNNALSRIFTRIKHARETTSSRRSSELMHTTIAAVPSIALSVIAHDAPTVATLHVPTSSQKRRKRSRHGSVVQHVQTVVDNVMPPIRTTITSQQNSGSQLPLAPFDHELLLEQLDDEQRRRAKRKLRMSKRFYEFYVAPITTFWAFSLTYSAFLILLTYVCLVRTPDRMQPAEWILLIYVLNIGLEQVRKVRLPSRSQAQGECPGFDGRTEVVWSKGVGVFVKLLELSNCVCGICARCRSGGASVR